MGDSFKCHALFQDGLEVSHVLSAECDQDIEFKLVPLDPKTENMSGVILKVSSAHGAQKFLRLLKDCKLAACIGIRVALEDNLRFSENVYSGKVTQLKRSATFGIFEENENHFEIICTSLAGVLLLIEPEFAGPGYTQITTVLVTKLQCDELEERSTTQFEL